MDTEGSMFAVDEDEEELAATRAASDSVCHGSCPMAASPLQAHVYPQGLVLIEDLSARLRACVVEEVGESWPVVGFMPTQTFADFRDQLLPKLASTEVAIYPLPPFTLPNGGAQAPSALVDCDGQIVEQRAGVYVLRSYEVAIAVMHVMNASNGHWYPLFLYAASSVQSLQRFRTEVRSLHREGNRTRWEAIGNLPWSSSPIPRPTDCSLDDLILPKGVVHRLRTEVLNFDSPEVVEMHEQLEIPWRRGVLLYGPPGNGKTSIVRAIGAELDLPGVVLRPSAGFDEDSLLNVFQQWRDRAPAILVIEDIDWLFSHCQVNVSTFLNLLDGIDQRARGLLLVATTNNPECLDPALNNRPGRLDSTIEIPAPEGDDRLAFLATKGALRGLEGEQIEETKSRTEGLSFAHLAEIVRLSCLMAIKDGRSSREPRDLLAAVHQVAQAHERAARHFAEKVDMGLRQAARAK